MSSILDQFFEFFQNDPNSTKIVDDVIIERLARNLIREYPLLLDIAPEEVKRALQQIGLHPKRARGPRRPATPVVAKGRETVNIRSDIIGQALLHGLRRDEMYTQYPDQGIAEYSQPFGRGKDGHLIVTIKPLESESMDTVIAALDTLGDGCVDTFLALEIIAIDQNGTENIRMSFLTNEDDILAVCGKKKTNGSYTPEQRAAVTAHLKTLSQQYIIATLLRPGEKRGKRGKQGQPTVLRAEGALIDLLSGKIGEYYTITGEALWEKRSIALGEWITMIPDLNRETSIVLRQLLAYSAKNEVYQKRLGLYISNKFRANARNGITFTCSMKTLLEGAGITHDRRIGEFRVAIENAITDLQRDNIVKKYERIVDTRPGGDEREAKVWEHARGWWEAYEVMLWKFYPPEYVKEQYRTLLKEGEE